MTRVIKADDVSREHDGAKPDMLDLPDFAAQARDIILDARKQAVSIVAQARAQADDTRRQTREQGYAEGLARGQNDGYADGKKQAFEEAQEQFAAEHRRLLDLARGVVEALAEAQGLALVRTAEEILNMAVMLAERIVTRVAREDVGAARCNLVKALELTGSGGSVVVKVNPAQLQSLMEYFSELAGVFDSRQVTIAPDEQISLGGVKVETPRGQIDATIETQLDNAVRALLGGHGGRSGSGSKQIGSYESARPLMGGPTQQPTLTIRTHGSA